MNNSVAISASDGEWLKRYYALRAVVSAAWVAIALTVGKANPPLGIALIIAYPAWDSFANYLDGRRSGGLRANPTQFVNLIASAIVALAVALAATRDFRLVIAIIGVWATISGILQLATAVRRWRVSGAQWPMALSGAQSALAGGFMIIKAVKASGNLSVADVAPYAAFGAIYFAISAAILFFRGTKQEAD